MGNVFPVIGVVVIAMFTVAMMVFHYSRAKSILQRWADKNGYEILSSEYRLMGGRFWWRRTENQEVYYVTIRTSEGQVRRGWVRCGGWFFGILSDQADVEWDE